MRVEYQGKPAGRRKPVSVSSWPGDTRQIASKSTAAIEKTQRRQLTPLRHSDMDLRFPIWVIGKLALSVAARIHKSQEPGISVRNHINLERRNY